MIPDAEPGETSDLITRVRAVDGVSDIYTPRAAVAQLPGIIAAAAGMAADGPTAEILVAVKDDIPTVAARIATSRLDSTPETARRVADTLLSATPEGTRITLQIARVH